MQRYLIFFLDIQKSWYIIINLAICPFNFSNSIFPFTIFTHLHLYIYIFQSNYYIIHAHDCLSYCSRASKKSEQMEIRQLLKSYTSPCNRWLDQIIIKLLIFLWKIHIHSKKEKIKRNSFKWSDNEIISQPILRSEAWLKNPLISIMSKREKVSSEIR